MSSRSIIYSYPNPNGSGPEFPPLNAEFEFKLPIKIGDMGLEVQVIKFFLGMGNIESTTPEFDAITTTKVSDWQRANRQKIYQELGGTPPGAEGFGNAHAHIEIIRNFQAQINQPGFDLQQKLMEWNNLLAQIQFPPGTNVRSLSLNAGSKEDLKEKTEQAIEKLRSPINVLRNTADQVVDAFGQIIPPGSSEEKFLIEQGSIGEATYDAMLASGLRGAAQTLFASHGFKSMAARMTPSELIAAFEGPLPEKPFPPTLTEDKKFIRYVYFTDLTEQEMRARGFQSDQDKFDLTLKYFRKAVLKVFDYYGKKKTWKVYGENDDFETQEYKKIIEHQNRGTFENGTERTFSVKEVNLSEQINGIDIDVLFGQPLEDGAAAKFASVKKWHTAGLRPGSVRKMEILIRNDLFELIEGGNHRGGTVDLTDPETYEKIAAAYETAEEAYKALKEFDLNDTMGDASDFMDKWTAAQGRYIEQQAKKALENAWEDALAGRGGLDEEFKRQLAANAAYQEAARRMSLKIGPTSKKYNVAKIKRRLKLVHEVMLGYEADIEEFKAKNRLPPERMTSFRGDPSPIIPNLNVQLEARMFAKIEGALENFLKSNGKTLNIQETGSAKKEEIEVFFAPVKKVMPPPKVLDENTTPNVNAVSKPPPNIEQVVGWRIHRVTYIKNGVSTPLVSGLPDFESEEPWLNPTTVGYFMSLDEMFKDASASDSCTDLMSSAAIEFYAKYTWPTLSFMYREKPPKGMLNINLDFNIDSIKNFDAQLTENLKLLDRNIDSLFASTFLKQKGKLIDASDVLPDFGSIPCDFREMFKQFLNKWDMQAILCDFAKCIPNFKFDFSWSFKLPSLPRIPTFNPLHFVIPQIRIAVIDIVMAFICKLVKKLLDTLRAPDCTDILRFGLAYLSEVALMGQEDPSPFENAPEKATMFEKAAETIKVLNLPPDAMDQESEQSMDLFFDRISMVLTPEELCDLLQGVATEEVCYVVLNVIMSIENGLSRHINTTDLVRRFFEALGSVVDPLLCEKVRELADIIIADELCPERTRSVRETLESVGASPSEIAEALKEASDRRDAFRQLAEEGGLQSLLPTEYDPGSLEEANMPGPYNNPVHDQMTSMAIKSLLDSIKSYFNMNARTFVDLLIDTSESLIQPGDPGFNALDYCYFLYYVSQAERLSNGDPVYELGKIDKMPDEWRAMSGQGGNAAAAVQYTAAVALLTEQGVPRRLWRHIHFIPQPDEERMIFDPSSPEGLAGAAKFGEYFDRFVISYLEKYRKLDAKVFPKFQALLALDSTSIARKFPGPYNKREFNIRLLTNLINRTPDTDVEILDATSYSDFAARFSVGMSDISFNKGAMTDCYRVSYLNATERYLGPTSEAAPGQDPVDPEGNPVPAGQGDRYDARHSKFTRVYNEYIPRKYKRLRESVQDLTSLEDPHPNGHLFRLPMFWHLMKNSYQSMSNGTLDAGWEEYSDNGPNGDGGKIIPKILGYVSDPEVRDIDQDGVISADDVLQTNWENSIAGTGVLSSNREAISPLYASVVDSINYRIHSSTRRSPFFDLHNLRLLKHAMSRTHILTKKDGEDCYVPNDRLLDFQRIMEEFMNSYKTETNSPSADPTQRDFSENGPLEESTIRSLVRLYIKVAVVEMLFKGIFLFSVVGCRNVFKSEFVVDYLVDNIIKTLDTTLRGWSSKRKVYDLFRRMSGLEDKDNAIRSVVLANLDIEIIEDFVNKLFTTITTVTNDHSVLAAETPDGESSIVPRASSSLGFYHSVKDKFYNELLTNIKEVPSIDNYPKITVRNRRPAEVADWADFMEMSIELQRADAAAAWAYVEGISEDLDPDVYRSDPDIEDGIMDSLKAFGTRSVVHDLFNEKFGNFVTRPLGPYIPNLYSQFVFRGDTAEDIEKKIDNGHFWIERFYRIGKFKDFHGKYLIVQSLLDQDEVNGGVGKGGLLTSIRQFPPVARDAEDKPTYIEEYISPNDLSELLFGITEFDTYRETLRQIRESVRAQAREYEFTRSVLAVLANDAAMAALNVRSYDATLMRWSYFNADRDETNLLIRRLQIDLGMAHSTDPNNKLEGRSLLGDMSYDPTKNPLPVRGDPRPRRVEIPRVLAHHGLYDVSELDQAPERDDPNLIYQLNVAGNYKRNESAGEDNFLYNWVNGSVPKDEFINRLMSRISILSNSSDEGFEYSPNLKQQGSWPRYMKPESLRYSTRIHNVLFYSPPVIGTNVEPLGPKRTEQWGGYVYDYSFLEYVRVMMHSSDNYSKISLRRKAELIIDLITSPHTMLAIKEYVETYTDPTLGARPDGATAHRSRSIRQYSVPDEAILGPTGGGPAHHWPKVGAKNIKEYDSWAEPFREEGLRTEMIAPIDGYRDWKIFDHFNARRENGNLQFHDGFKRDMEHMNDLVPKVPIFQHADLMNDDSYKRALAAVNINVPDNPNFLNTDMGGILNLRPWLLGEAPRLVERYLYEIDHKYIEDNKVELYALMAGGENGDIPEVMREWAETNQNHAGADPQVWGGWRNGNDISYDVEVFRGTKAVNAQGRTLDFDAIERHSGKTMYMRAQQITENLDLYETAILPAIQDVYNHLKENLHIGYRLMFGHKAIREEEVIQLAPSSSRVTISPKDIYKEFNTQGGGDTISSVDDGSIGIKNKPYCFSKKRAFLGYVDKEPITFSRNTIPTQGRLAEGQALNPASIFHEEAVNHTIWSNLDAAEDYSSPDMGITQEKLSFDPGKNLVYSIIIDEAVEHIGAQCFEDLWAKFTVPAIDNLDSVVAAPFYPVLPVQADIFHGNELFDFAGVPWAMENEFARIEKISELIDVRIRSARGEQVDQALLRKAALLESYIPNNFDARENIEGQITFEHVVEFVQENAQPGEDILFTAAQFVLERLRMYEVSRGYFTPGSDYGSTSGLPVRKIFLTGGDDSHPDRESGCLFDKFHAKLVQKLLSINVERDDHYVISVANNDPRDIKAFTDPNSNLEGYDVLRYKTWKVKDDRPDQDYNPAVTPWGDIDHHRLLFDVLFPLDRYAGLHFMQNVLIFDQDEDTAGLFQLTRLIILYNILLLDKIDLASDDLQKPDDKISTSLDFTGVPTHEQILNMIWEIVKEAIIRLAKLAGASLVRGLADAADFAYRDMRKFYKKNQCEPQAGLTEDSLGDGMFSSFGERNFEGQLNKGWARGKDKECSNYHPVNHFTSDFVGAISAGMLDTLKNQRDVFKAFRATLESKDSRYGYLLTPLGRIALNAMELPSEETVRVRSEQGCPDCTPEPEEKVDPVGECSIAEEEREAKMRGEEP